MKYHCRECGIELKKAVNISLLNYHKLENGDGQDICNKCFFKLKTIKFSKDFSKLDDRYFSTIRKPGKKLRTGNWHPIQTPTRTFKALLIADYTEKLKHVPTRTLTVDTDTETREEALEVLKGFYPDLSWDSTVRLLWFLKKDKEADIL